jgi:hypothetical protein
MIGKHFEKFQILDVNVINFGVGCGIEDRLCKLPFYESIS